MDPEGAVSLILVSSCGSKLFAGGVLKGLQAIFYIQSKKSYVALHSVLQRLAFIILRIDFFQTRCNIAVIIHKNSLCNNKILILMNATSLSFSFLFDLTLTLHWRSYSALCMPHMLMKMIYLKLNYYNLSNAFSLIMHHYFLKLV